MAQFADDLAVPFERYSLLFLDASELVADVVRFGLRDANGFGRAIHNETKQLLFVVPLSITAFQHFEQDRVLATAMQGTASNTA
jgi:hypothetical protein